MFKQAKRSFDTSRTTVVHNIMLVVQFDVFTGSFRFRFESPPGYKQIFRKNSCAFRGKTVRLLFEHAVERHSISYLFL